MMRKIAYISILLLFGIASCMTLKKSKVTHEVVTKDTSTAQQLVFVHDTVVRSHDIYVHDTVVKIQEAVASTDLTADDFMPAADVNGKRIPRDFSFGNGREHGSVHVDTNGKAHIECKSDSFAMVIQNMLIERDSLLNSLTTKDSSNKESSHISDIKDTSVKVTNHMPFMTGFWIGAICFLAGAFVVLAVQAYLKMHKL